MCWLLGTTRLDEERQQVAGEAAAAPEATIELSLEDVNTLDDRPPPVYYVIVGRGPMAVVDHRTLMGSQRWRDFVGDRTVLHVGFPNPWPRYLRHGLGQPIHLLSLPGFQAANQPSGADPVANDVDGGLDSQYFGGCVDAEFDGLTNVEVAEEWVAMIQSRAREPGLDARIGAEEEGGPVFDAINARLQDPWPDFEDVDLADYRLCLYDPEHRRARWVYASAIDLCTGPGRPNVFPPGDGPSPAMDGAKTPPWLSPERWIGEGRWADRRVLNGVDAIRDEVEWNPNERICVTAGGGVGLNAAEKARVNGCSLDWFGREALLPIFENPRNITYLKDLVTDQRCGYGNRAAAGVHGEDDLISWTRGHRMGRGAMLRSATVAPNEQVVIRLQRYQPPPPPGGLPAAANPCHIRDWWRNTSDLNGDGFWEFSPQYQHEVAPVQPSTWYDRLVIPNGQGTGHVGQPRLIAGHLNFQPVEKENRMVALASADGRVRILGAACNDYFRLDWATWDANNRQNVTASDRMWSFHATLPVSAVPDGFIICGANTALANDYFERTPNHNVNTMTLAEITALIGNANLAATIVQHRNARNGYGSLADLQAACASTDPALARLRFTY